MKLNLYLSKCLGSIISFNDSGWERKSDIEDDTNCMFCTQYQQYAVLQNIILPTENGEKKEKSSFVCFFCG